MNEVFSLSLCVCCVCMCVFVCVRVYCVCLCVCVGAVSGELDSDVTQGPCTSQHLAPGGPILPVIALVADSGQ